MLRFVEPALLVEVGRRIGDVLTTVLGPGWLGFLPGQCGKHAVKIRLLLLPGFSSKPFPNLFWIRFPKRFETYGSIMVMVMVSFPLGFHWVPTGFLLGSCWQPTGFSLLILRTSAGLAILPGTV